MMGGLSNRSAAACVFLGAVLWGTAGVASRWIHEAGTADGLEIGFWRLTLAVPLLLVIAWSMAGTPHFGSRRNLACLALMGIALGGFQFFYFTAISAVGVAVATLVGICTIPVVVALLAMPVYGERLGLVGWAALGTAVTGTLALILGAHDPQLPGAAGAAVGIPLALGACLSFSILTLAGRAVSGQTDPLWTTSFTCALGAVALGLVLLIVGPPGLPAGGFTWSVLAWIALLPTALAYVLFYSGVRRIPSRVAGVLILGEPLTATLLARALHAEVLGPLGWMGAILLCLAMLVMAFRS